MPTSIPANTPLPTHLVEALRAELREGEQLIWSAQPHKRLFARQMIPVAAFGAMFFGFSLFWIVGAMWTAFGTGGMGGGGQGGVPAVPSWIALVLAAVGLPILVIGAGLLLSPLVARQRAKHTVYALSDQRIIMMNGTLFGGREIRSFASADLGRMKRRERADGTGDLIFEEQITMTQGRHSAGTHTAHHGLIGVSAVGELERLVRETLHLE